MDRLLNLIEKGDPEAILSEQELVPRFNELLKYDLVALKNEKVLLTEEGKAAKKEGVEVVIKRKKRLNYEKLQQTKTTYNFLSFSLNNKSLKSKKNFLLFVFLLITFFIFISMYFLK